MFTNDFRGAGVSVRDFIAEQLRLKKIKESEKTAEDKDCKTANQ